MNVWNNAIRVMQESDGDERMAACKTIADIANLDFEEVSDWLLDGTWIDEPTPTEVHDEWVSLILEQRANEQILAELE